MSLLTNNQVQSNIIKHQAALKVDLNRAISTITSVTAEYDKLAMMLHTEAGIGEIVDNQDSNANLRFVGRKHDAVQALADSLLVLKNLKGADNAATAVNVAAQVTATGYVHAAYKGQFDAE